MARSKQVHTRGGTVHASQLPLGIRAVESLCCGRISNVPLTKTSYQIFIFCLTFAIYAIYTLTRRPFSVVKIVLCPPCTNASFTDLSPSNLSSEEGELYLEGWPPFNSTNGRTLLGSIDYSLIFAYATGLYISGYVADRVNLRYFLTTGMVGSGLAAIFLGLGYFFRIHHLAYFIVFQILAGFMQSTGWPGLLGVTAKWFGKKNRGKILGFWGSCTFVGSILGYFVPSFFIQSENVEESPWGWAFLVPAFVILTAAVVTFLFLVTDPEHLGFLPTVENTNSSSEDVQDTKLKEKDFDHKDGDDNSSISDDIEDPTASPETPQKTKGIGFFRALLIPGVIEYSLCFFCNKFVVYSFNFWLPFYVAVSYPELGGRNAAWISTLFDFGGITGGVLIGVISDRLSSRSIVLVPMLIIGVPLLLFLHSFGHVSLVFYCFIVYLVGTFVTGPHIIISGAVSNDLGTHKSLRDDQHAKSIVSGIIDGTGSIGAALGPLVVGVVTDKLGWDSVFYIFTAMCLLSALLLLRLVITDSKTLISRLRSWHSYRSRPQTGAAEDKIVNSAKTGPLEARNPTFEHHSDEVEYVISTPL